VVRYFNQGLERVAPLDLLELGKDGVWVHIDVHGLATFARRCSGALPLEPLLCLGRVSPAGCSAGGRFVGWFLWLELDVDQREGLLPGGGTSIAMLVIVLPPIWNMLIPLDRSSWLLDQNWALLSHSAKEGDTTICIIVYPFSKAICIMCCWQVSRACLQPFLERSG
jgi:hypothetical protein